MTQEQVDIKNSHFLMFLLEKLMLKSLLKSVLGDPISSLIILLRLSFKTRHGYCLASERDHAGASVSVPVLHVHRL